MSNPWPADKVARLVSPRPRCVTRPVLWHIERVEERLRFHLRGVEIVGDYRNPIQCRVRLVARPSAKKLDGEIHHESALCLAPRRSVRADFQIMDQQYFPGSDQYDRE